MVYTILLFNIVQYRDTQNSGLISYSEALKLGTSLSFFASVVLAFYTVFYINFIDTEFINNLISQTEQQILMSTPDISDEDLDKALEITSKMTKASLVFYNGNAGNNIYGFHIFISNFFLYKERVKK